MSGNSYQSDRVYDHETHYYWRLRGEWCPDFLVDEVFNTSTYFKVMEGEYEAQDSSRVYIEENQFSLITDVAYSGFYTSSWSDDTLTFSLNSFGGLNYEIDATMTYVVADKTISADGSYYVFGTSHSLSFSGKKVE